MKTENPWQTIESALEYQPKKIEGVSEETVVSDVLRDILGALNSIDWSGSDYPNPGSRLKNLRTALNEARSDPSKTSRRIFVEVISGRAVPKLPTKFDQGKLSEVPLDQLEAWILADLAVLKSNVGGVNHSEIVGAGKLFHSYISAISYISNKSLFVASSQLATVKAATKSARDAAKKADAANDAIAQRLTDFDGDISSRQNEFIKVLDRAKNFADYKQLYEYFNDKAGGHLTAFRLLFGSFVIALLAFSGAFWWFRSDIIPFLPKISNNSFEIGQTIFVIIPVVLAVWVLRVLLRLALMNYRLQEDARNRQVLIQTLAAMQDNQKDLSEQERVVAYSAIFRSSLADQSELDVSNPTVADIAGMFRKS